MRYRGSSNAAIATCVLLAAIGHVLQCAAPVAEAAASPNRRGHGKRGRPGHSMAADQPNADNDTAVASTDYDDANYDEGAEYDEENNDYHKRPPVDRRTIYYDLCEFGIYVTGGTSCLKRHK